jgi:hypothetical protein
MLDFHCTVGVGQLKYPAGVCANRDVIAVSSSVTHLIYMFQRADGAPLRQFGGHGTGAGELRTPGDLCFMKTRDHLAVAEADNYRVSVFTVHGMFVRHVGIGLLQSTLSVACSAFGELIVSDVARVYVFDADGGTLRSFPPLNGLLFCISGSRLLCARTWASEVLALE